jgi:RIO kinase 1
MSETHIQDIAAGQSPAYDYIPNQGYSNVNDGTEVAPPRQGIPEPLDEEDEDDNDFDDIFDDENVDDLDWADESGDFTKNYNRQKRLIEVSSNPATAKVSAPKANTQKPKANTSTSVDDQISSLAKHTGKITLEDRWTGSGGGHAGNKDRSDRATSEQVLDPRTRMILLQMINRNIVSEISGCLSTGKEANVYYALSLPAESAPKEALPLHRAIKVFKTSILVFKDRDKYVTGEHRFRHGHNKGSNRAKVKVWAEKEFRNLKRMHSAGLPVPEPVHLRLHVIVMEFIGSKKGWPAPRLTNVTFEDSVAEGKWQGIYEELLGLMKSMYQKCKLVHADLSEYNLLYQDGKLWIIDVGQSVEHDHPRSLDFLRMDIKNVTSFFDRKGVQTLSEQEVFTLVTGIKVAQEETKASGEVRTEADREVDTEIYRTQYIPRTLEQVYDIERDAAKVNKGETEDLVYRGLLADKKEVSEEDGSGSTDESDDSDESGDDFVDFGDKTPRGKRFEDKEAKKVCLISVINILSY